jgi:hypothetical protein
MVLKGGSGDGLLVDGMRSALRGDGWFAKTELQTGGVGVAWLTRSECS